MDFYCLYDSWFGSPNLLRSRLGLSHATFAVPAWGREALRDPVPNGCGGDYVSP